MPVHFTDQFVAFTPGAGEAPPYTTSTPGSTRLATTAPDRSVVLWYWPNRPVPVPDDGVRYEGSTGGNWPLEDATPCAKLTVAPLPARVRMPWYGVTR